MVIRETTAFGGVPDMCDLDLADAERERTWKDYMVLVGKQGSVKTCPPFPSQALLRYALIFTNHGSYLPPPTSKEFPQFLWDVVNAFAKEELCAAILDDPEGKEGTDIVKLMKELHTIRDNLKPKLGLCACIGSYARSHRSGMDYEETRMIMSPDASSIPGSSISESEKRDLTKPPSNPTTSPDTEYA